MFLESSTIIIVFFSYNDLTKSHKKQFEKLIFWKFAPKLDMQMAQRARLVSHFLWPSTMYWHNEYTSYRVSTLKRVCGLRLKNTVCISTTTSQFQAHFSSNIPAKVASIKIAIPLAIHSRAVRFPVSFWSSSLCNQRLHLDFCLSADFFWQLFWPCSANFPPQKPHSSQ